MAIATRELTTTTISAPVWLTMAAAPDGDNRHPLLDAAARFDNVEGGVLDVTGEIELSSVWEDALDIRVASL